MVVSFFYANKNLCWRRTDARQPMHSRGLPPYNNFHLSQKHRAHLIQKYDDMALIRLQRGSLSYKHNKTCLFG